MEDKILEFNNKQYKLKVEFYDNTKMLKVSAIDIQSKENIEITTSGVELVIPSPPTPDCVMIDSEKNEELVNRLLELKILGYCNLIFAKFNMPELYKYDKKGTMEFLDYHTVKIEFEEGKGNSLQEVKNNLLQEVRNVFRNKNYRKILHEKDLPVKYEVIYTLINSKNPKNSFALCWNDSSELFCIVYPYVKDLQYKLNFIPEWKFDFTEAFLGYLEEGYKIQDFKSLEYHQWIWNDIEDNYPDLEYQKGLNEYLKYCKINGITKQKLDNSTSLSDTPDIMKYYQKNKEQER